MSVVDMRLPVTKSKRRKYPSPIIVLAMGFVALIVLCALFAPLIAPHDPSTQDIITGLSDPSADHWLGTNDLGQDVLSRLIYGSRNAFIGPLIVAVLSTLIGSIAGLAAGYLGGRVDAVLMQWVDLMLSVPVLLVVIVLVGVVGGSYTLAVVILSILVAPGGARLVRAATLEQRPRPYVEAAEAIGIPAARIIRRHIWPNVAPIAVANGFLVFAFSLVTLSSLSFLGLGVGLETPDWGLMLASSRRLIFENPVVVLSPGVALVLLAAASSVIGDWAAERSAQKGTGR